MLHWLEFTGRLVNMSRILRRPMFKKGGPTNDGIMTGIVDRENHALSNPDGVGFSDRVKNRMDLIQSAVGGGGGGKEPSPSIFNLSPLLIICLSPDNLSVTTRPFLVDTISV